MLQNINLHVTALADNLYPAELFVSKKLCSRARLYRRRDSIARFFFHGAQGVAQGCFGRFNIVYPMCLFAYRDA